MTSAKKLKTGLGVAAILMVISLMGLNLYYLKHPSPSQLDPYRELLTEMQARVDDCERKLKAALPEAKFVHVLEGSTGKDGWHRLETHLEIPPATAEEYQRLQAACTLLQTSATQAPLKTEIALQKKSDGVLIKVIVTNDG